MAHSLSAARADRLRRAEPLARWQGWLVYARCPAGHPMARPLAVAALLALADPPATMGALAQRLRCGRCRARPDGLALRRSADSPHWVVVIFPPGLQPELIPYDHARVAWWQAARQG
jgi:hypothetical protein